MTAYNIVLLCVSVAYTVFLFVAANLPSAGAPSLLLPGAYSKLYHAGAFAVLTVLLLEGLSAKDGWGRVAAVAVIVLTVGAAIEIVQPFFGRTCSLADWIADLAGMLAAMAVWALARFLANRGDLVLTLMER